MLADVRKETLVRAPFSRGSGFLRWGAAVLCLEVASLGAVVSVQDSGAGKDYMSGEPITLPAASLSPRPFTNGVQVIRNRLHTARPVVFDANGSLVFDASESVPVTPNPTNGATNGKNEHSSGLDARDRLKLSSKGFPDYLENQPFVWFLQDVRHYTNYTCTVTVDRPATFYLLVDNRVNDYLADSPFDDPTFGPPDTQWVLNDGWKRVNTGLSPALNSRRPGDYVGIDEGNNSSINNAYAVYAKRLDKAGSITVGTEFDGNIYCLVISTNAPAESNLVSILGSNLRR